MSLVSCNKAPNGYVSVEFSVCYDTILGFNILVPALPTHDFINRRNALLAAKFLEYLEREHPNYDDFAHVSN